jgi:flagellar assembly protein FliH
MIDRIETAKQAFLQHWEQNAVKMVMAIAERVIDRHLPELPDVPLRLLRETLELAAGSTSLRIRLNKADYVALKPQIDLLIQEMIRSVPTEIVSDVSVSPGGCIIETPQGTIDNRIESRIARIEQDVLHQ